MASRRTEWEKERAEGKVRLERQCARLYFVLWDIPGLKNPPQCEPIQTLSLDKPLSQISETEDWRAEMAQWRELNGLNDEDCQTSFMWDRMLVEKEATPMGLGMENGETIFILPTRYIKDQKLLKEAFKPVALKILIRSEGMDAKRSSQHVSVGLNVVVGEEEGGLPVLVGYSKLQEQLANLKTALLPALKMTMEQDMAQGHSLMHRPDFSLIEEKLEAGVYKTGDEGMKDIMKILQRYNH